MENKELGFRCLFIFQERITADGELIAPVVEETDIAAKSPQAKENSPERTENVSGATTPKNERATAPKEDQIPDNLSQFAAAAQLRANQIGSRNEQ
ncbi:MAG: hypothetical protein ACD_43C00239G0002 [uncultured bacterium]|nr:MAG: hypothetical protein ACD_43C00239G0002 [uncultured bacterium]